MTIPFAEYCMACYLCGEDYEYFHAATREQITALVQHVQARDARELYVHRLNLHWFGTCGIGETLDYRS